MKKVFHNGFSALLILGLGSAPALAKEKCWILENDTTSAGELRLKVMSSSGKANFLLNGTRVVQGPDGAIESFHVTGGAVKMGSSADVTLTETGTETVIFGDVPVLTTWTTLWHLDLSTDDLSGTASAITTMVDENGEISHSASSYGVLFDDCSDDDDSSDDDSSDDDSGDDDSGHHGSNHK